MKSGRSVKWADPLSRLRLAPSPTLSAGSEGGATAASSSGEAPVIITQQSEGRASRNSTCDCLRRVSSATPEERLRGQHLLSRRFRCAATEAEYLEWHFSIWGRRSTLRTPSEPPFRPRTHGANHESQAARLTAPRGPPACPKAASGPRSRALAFDHLGGGRRTLRSASRGWCSSTSASCWRGAARAGGRSTWTTAPTRLAAS